MRSRGNKSKSTLTLKIRILTTEKAISSLFHTQIFIYKTATPKMSNYFFSKNNISAINTCHLKNRHFIVDRRVSK